MRKPLPSLNALRSFETTVRLGSVTRAAAELCVTPSAVSHQISKLEERLGHPLVCFSSGVAELTERGSVLMPGLADGFMRIRDAVSLLEEQCGSRTLTVVARPFFASRWLSPRLDRFWEAHPNIGLRMHYMREPVEHHNDVVDAAIEWHISPPPAVHSVKLVPGALTPVCSPALVAAGEPEPGLELLARQTLFRESHQDYWEQWLELAGLRNFEPHKTVVLDDGTIRLQACVEGKGIDLSVPDFLGQEFSDNLLTAPFEDLQLEGGYFLVVRKPASPDVHAFQDWLLDEVAQSPAA